MSETHVTNNLAAFLHGELDEETAFLVATHLSQCTKCRTEFEEIKLGDQLSQNVVLEAPPEKVWANIEQQLINKPSPPAARKRSSFPLPSPIWQKFFYALAMTLLIVIGIWWFRDKSAPTGGSVDFDAYLSQLESQPRSSFPQPFAVLPAQFSKVDSATAHSAVAMKNVGKSMDAHGYSLYGNRVRQMTAGHAAQFIYGNANEVLAVFVLPKSVRCEFGQRSVESATIGGIPYANVASDPVSTLWLSNDRHQLVFVTLVANDEALSAIVRMFVR